MMEGWLKDMKDKIKSSLSISVMLTLAMILTIVIHVNVVSYFFKDIYFSVIQEILMMVCMMVSLFLMMNVIFKVIYIDKRLLSKFVLVIFLVLSLALSFKAQNPYMSNSSIVTVRSISLNIFSFMSDLKHANFSKYLLIGNFAIYIPVGFCVSYLSNTTSSKRILLLSCLFITYIVLLETIQYITNLGIFDVGDIFLNYLGFLCGVLLYLLVYKKKYITLK